MTVGAPLHEPLARRPPIEPPAPQPAGARLREHLRVPLFRNAYALIGSTVLMTGLGVVASLAAAHLYTPEDFGRGQATVNAVMLLGGIGNLRLMNVLTRFLPRARERSAWLVSRCYLLVVGASLVACLFYLTALGGVLPVEELMGDVPWAGLWLTVTVVAFALFTVQDAVLTGLRQATWVPVKNGVHGLAKLVLVVALAGALPASGILASWAIPTLLALVPVNLLIARRLLPANTRRDVEPEDLSARRLVPFAAGEYTGALCELAVANLIPLVILAQLGPKAAAFFGVAWLIGTTLDHIVIHFGSSLTVEGASDPRRLPMLTRDLLRRSALVVGPISAVVVLGAPLLLLPFGTDFSAEAGGVLRLLGLALLPRLVCLVAVAVARVRNDVPRVVGIQAVLAAGTLAGTIALLGPMGLPGPGIAYLAISVVVALAVTPRLLHDLHVPAHLKGAMPRTDRAPVFKSPEPDQALATSLAHQQSFSQSFSVPAAAPKTRPSPIGSPLPLSRPENGRKANGHRPEAPRRPRRAAALEAVPLGVSLLLAVWSLVQTDRNDAGGVLGIAAVLPVTWWLAAGVLVAGFIWLVFAEPISRPEPGTASAPARPWILLAHIVGLVVLLHGTPGFVEAHARFPTAWTHIGFVDYIRDTGTIDPGYDARYNWPGAFSFGAFLSDVTGAESSRALVRFAPVVVNLVLLVPLALILRHVTKDQRIRWVALLVFVVTHWIGQDYFAPQAVALISYLVIVALLLRWFRWTDVAVVSKLDLLARVRRRFPRLTRDDRLVVSTAPPPPARAAQLFGLVAVITAIGAYLSFSHQLTPFMLVIASAVLILCGRVDRPQVPLILGVCALAWAALGTTGYLQSHLDEITSSVGDLSGSVEDHGERIGPDPVRQFVLATRFLVTGGVVGLAAVGLWRQWRARRADWGIAALAAAPVGLAALNSYGGEIFLRISLFSLPFLAVLAGFAFVREGREPRAAWRGGIALLVVTALLVPLFVIARFGNEAYERIYSDDIAAWDFVVEHAPPGATVVVPDFAGPWRYQSLTYLYLKLYSDEAGQPVEAGALDDLVTSEGTPAYLILGTASDEYRQIVERYPDSWQDDLVDDLLATGRYEIVFTSGETRVLERR